MVASVHRAESYSQSVQVSACIHCLGPKVVHYKCQKQTGENGSIVQYQSLPCDSKRSRRSAREATGAWSSVGRVEAAS
jgi:hypothetical protein